jgi:hypothetical protein
MLRADFLRCILLEQNIPGGLLSTYSMGELQCALIASWFSKSRRTSRPPNRDDAALATRDYHGVGIKRSCDH